MNTSGIIRVVTGNRVMHYLFLVLLATVAVKYTIFYYGQEKDWSLSWARYIYRQFRSYVKDKSVLPTSCYNSIPHLEPFDDSLEYLRNISALPKVNCEKKKYHILFNSTLNSTIIPAKGENYILSLGYKSCCYGTVMRSHEAYNPDWSERHSSKCYPISFDKETKIPAKHEFIVIYCKKVKDTSKGFGRMLDMHAFVHQKQKNKYKEVDSKETENTKYNVLIWGIDSVSRMHFLRTMPKTYSYLKEINAVDMLGYNKVGDNTFPNLFPMLTSQDVSEAKCVNQSSLDGCPFIWKEYAKKGYLTTLAEDRPGISIFNFEWPGFKKQPTDYYLRPLMRFAVYKKLSEGYHCYGPQLNFKFLLDYMKKNVYTMNKLKKNFFHFTWATGLTHDTLSTAYVGDPMLLESIKWMEKSGYLNDTILILMSDHGSRCRRSVRGQLEDRLPFMFFVFPDSFKSKYSRAYLNLLFNAKRLTTTFDLHETLKDILNLETLQESYLSNRQLLYDDDKEFRGRKKMMKRRGISHFLPIPENRTCEMAGIPQIFCSCKLFKIVSENDQFFQEIGKAAVEEINNILKGKSQCVPLQLSKVIMAQEEKNSQNMSTKAYLITFETNPGEGRFEALLRKNLNSDKWNVTGKILRTNRYGNQSYCVRGQNPKLYCYCNNLIHRRKSKNK